MRPRPSLHHWSFEHSGSCALEGTVKVAARCASCLASGLWLMCPQLPRCRVLRCRASEVHVHLTPAAQCKKGSAARAGLTFLTCEAAPCHRAGCGYLQCCRQRVRKGACSTSRPSISYVRCSAEPSCRMWLPAGLPSTCARRSGSTCRPYIYDVCCSVMPSCLMWLSAVLPSACAKVPAAPAGIFSPMSVAEPGHCAGGGR